MGNIFNNSVNATGDGGRTVERNLTVGHFHPNSTVYGYLSAINHVFPAVSSVLKNKLSAPNTFANYSKSEREINRCNFYYNN